MENTSMNISEDVTTNPSEETASESTTELIEPIYKSKDGQVITHSQLLGSGYSVDDINSAKSGNILSVIGDTKDAEQGYKSKDGQLVTTKDLLESGYKQQDIDSAIVNGILSPMEKKNSGEPLLDKSVPTDGQTLSTISPSKSQLPSDFNIVEQAQLAKKLKDESYYINPSSVNVMGDVEYESNEGKISQAEEIKKQLKDAGYDADKIVDMYKDVPPQFYNKEGYRPQDEQKNPLLFQRTIANASWIQPLKAALKSKLESKDISEEDYQTARKTISDIQNSSAATPYSSVSYGGERINYGVLSDLIRKNIDDEDLQKRMLKNLSTERAVVYGETDSPAKNTDVDSAPERKYLDHDQTIAYQYLQDSDPQAAKGYESVFINPSMLTGSAKVGWEDKMAKLKNIGLQLQQNYVREKVKTIQSQIDSPDTDPNNIPILQNKLDELLGKSQNLDDEYSNIKTKYPTVLFNDAISITKDLLGDKFTDDYGTLGGAIAWGLGKTAQEIGSTWEGIKDLATAPFLDNEGSKVNQLAASGDLKEEEAIYGLPESKKALQTSTVVLKPELKSKIDAIIKNDKLSYDEKYNQVNNLVMSNQDMVSRVPIQGGKFNINPTTALYSVLGLGSSLVPFMALEAVTGGGATAGIARKLLSSFNAAALTSYHRELGDATARGEANPTKTALLNTAIQAAKMAGAGTPQMIKGLYGTKTAVGEMVNKMSDDAIEAAMKKSNSTFELFGKTIKTKPLTDAAIATVKAAGEGVKGGVKFESVMRAGDIVSGIASGDADKVKQQFNEALVGVLSFGAFGTIMGAKGQYKKINELETGSLLKASENPEGMIETATDMFKNNKITKEKYDEIVKNIKTAASVSSDLKYIDDNGNPLDEKKKGQLLLLKVQESNLLQQLAGNVPEKFKENVNKQIENINEDVNEVTLPEQKEPEFTIGGKAVSEEDWLNAVKNNLNVEIDYNGDNEKYHQMLRDIGGVTTEEMMYEYKGKKYKVTDTGITDLETGDLKPIEFKEEVISNGKLIEEAQAELPKQENVGEAKPIVLKSGQKITPTNILGNETVFHASHTERKGRLKEGSAEGFGEGIYFGTDKEGVQGDMGNNLTEAKLNLSNPVYTSSKEWSEVEQRALDNYNKDYTKKNISDFNEDQFNEQGYVDKYKSVDDIPNSKYISDAAKELGYDAIIDKNKSQYGHEILVLDESKIIYPEDIAELPKQKENVGEEAVTTPTKVEPELPKHNKDNQPEFITATKRQKVNRVGDELVVTDAKTGNDVSRKTYNKAIEEYANNFDFTHGEEGESTTQSLDPNKTLSEVIETSNNPHQIAVIYAQNNVPFVAKDMTIDDMISEYGIPKISIESFRRHGDINRLSRKMRSNYIADKNETRNQDYTKLDVFAKELSDHYFPDGDGTEISPEDIVNFMETYESKKELRDKKNPLLSEAEDKFKKLTGLNLTRQIADKAIGQKIEKESQAEQNLLKQDYENRQQLEDEYWRQYKETNGFTEEADTTRVNKQEKGNAEVGEKVEPKAEPKKAEIPEQKKSLAEKIRQAKIGGDKAFDATIGLPVAIWDGAVELVAKSIEAGMEIADAIKRGVNYIEKNHRGKWNKKAYNEKVVEALGYKGINIKGEDVITKQMDDKQSADIINGFYSPLEQGILDTKIEKTTGKDWAKKLEGTTEGDELKFTGMSDFLKENADKSLTKQNVLDYMKNNRIEISEVIKDEWKKVEMSKDEQSELNSLIKQEDLLGFDSTAEAKKAILESDNWLKDWDVQNERFIELGNKYRDSFKKYQEERVKYKDYQLPGEKTNYKEVLITLPTSNRELQNKVLELEKVYEKDGSNYNLRELENAKEELAKSRTTSFRSSHYDEPNILAHIRMNTRIDAEGNKVLHIEEFQSDWGQQGKKIGFTSEGFISKEKADEIENKIYSLQDEYYEKNIPLKEGQGREDALYEYALKKGIVTEKEIEQLTAYNDKDYKENQKVKVPNAPFVTETANWTKLAWKVAVKEAVKEGVDKITWTTGEQQNERYDLSKQVNAIMYGKREDGTYDIRIIEKGSTDPKLFKSSVPKEELESIVGKEVSKKIINNEGTDVPFRALKKLSGVDLKIGGTGMKGFYGSPSEGKLGIVGEVAKSLFKQEPKTTELIQDKYDSESNERTLFSEWLYSAGEGLYTPEQTQLEIDKNSKLYNQFKKTDIYKNFERNISKEKDVMSIQHSIDITPEIKQGVKEGMAMFKSPFDKLAEKIRKGKIGNDIAMGTIPFLKEVWNGAVEAMAIAAEVSGDIKEAVEKGIEYIRNSDWYKNLSLIDKQRAEKTFKDEFGIEEELPKQEEGYESVKKERLKEIGGVKEMFEKRTKIPWSKTYQSALENLQKMYPNKSIYEAMKSRVNNFALRLDNNELFNPTSEDIAVFTLFRAETQKRINQVEGLDSEDYIERQAALSEINTLNDDLFNIARVTNPGGESGRAFAMLQSEAKMDENYGLKIRRSELMNANGGEKLSDADMEWTQRQWEKEKELMKQEQDLKEKSMQEDFDKKVSELEKEYEAKLKLKGQGGAVKSKTLSQSGKDIADKIRKLAIQKGQTAVDVTFGLRNLAVEAVAQLVEKGATIAEAIVTVLKDAKFKGITSKDLEDHISDSLTKKDKEEELNRIKEFAEKEEVTDITDDMVRSNLIRDYVNSHVGEVDKKDLFDTALKDLKEILPNVTKEKLLEAYLKKGEFKQPTRQQLEGGVKQQQNELKKIAKEELTADQQQKIKLDAQKELVKRRIKELQRKIDNNEFEEPLPVQLKKSDAELIKLQKQKSIIEGEYRKKKQEFEEKNKGAWKKGIEFLRSVYVNTLISLALPKVGTMAVVRPASEAITKQTLGRVFESFFPNWAKAAKRGGESTSIASMKQGLNAMIRQYSPEQLEGMYDKAEKEYTQAKKEYLDYKDSASPNEKKLQELKNNMNEKLVKTQGAFLYKFIGGSSIKDALQSLVERSNEIEKQFGNIQTETLKDSKGIEKINYVLNFIGRSHSALKTFSGRASFASGFMARLEGAVEAGEDISDASKIIEIANESYLDWERGKYQQDNPITNMWNKIVDAVDKSGKFGNAISSALRFDVPVTRVPINLLHEALGEYTFGTISALAKAMKVSKEIKSQLKEEGFTNGEQIIDGLTQGTTKEEFKKELNKRISEMDGEQAATIMRCFRKGGIGAGLAAYALISGAIQFGIFPHMGQKKKKEEGELNPGDIMVGDKKLSESVSKIVEHIPAFYPIGMSLGLVKAYDDEIKKGKTTKEAVAKSLYTHLKIIESGFPQSKVISPISIGEGVAKGFEKKAEQFGLTSIPKEESTLEKPEYAIYKEKGVRIPKTGKVSQIRVDTESGYMTAEQYDKYVSLVDKYMQEGFKSVDEDKNVVVVKGLKDLPNVKYVETVGEKEKTILGKDLPTDDLQNKVNDLHEKAVRKAKEDLGLIKKKPTRTVKESEQ